MWNNILDFPRNANDTTLFQWMLFLVAMGMLLFFVHAIARTLPG